MCPLKFSWVATIGFSLPKISFYYYSSSFESNISNKAEAEVKAYPKSAIN